LDISNVVLIMDNATIHWTRALQELCNSQNIRILLLPPHSPFLNPIENLFSKWKHIVKSDVVTNEDELLARINTESNEVTENDCDGYFRNMLRYIGRCMNNEEIDD
jgi:transposase